MGACRLGPSAGSIEGGSDPPKVPVSLDFDALSDAPETDTPEKLKQSAERFHAKPGWLFLTGPKENVDFALSKLGHKVARKEDHLTLFIVGNEETGLWKKIAPGVTTDSLEVIVESVLNHKG